MFWLDRGGRGWAAHALVSSRLCSTHRFHTEDGRRRRRLLQRMQECSGESAVLCPLRFAIALPLRICSGANLCVVCTSTSLGVALDFDSMLRTRPNPYGGRRYLKCRNQRQVTFDNMRSGPVFWQNQYSLALLRTTYLLALRRVELCQTWS